MREYVPFKHQGQIQVTGHDATRWAQPARYHRILLAAPCSSERHLAQRGVILKDHWSLSRSKRNAEVQLALLLAPARPLLPFGHVVYSTCSTSPVENDVSKAAAKLAKQGVRLGCMTDSVWRRLQEAGVKLTAGGADGVGPACAAGCNWLGPLVLERAESPCEPCASMDELGLQHVAAVCWIAGTCVSVDMACNIVPGA